MATPALQQELAAAISMGAPLYNQGNVGKFINAVWGGCSFWRCSLTWLLLLALAQLQTDQLLDCEQCSCTCPA
jgi:hypothetical protein